MTFNREQMSEEGSANEYGSDSNTGLNDANSELTRGRGEQMIIRTLQRLIGPIFEPIFRPLIYQIVKDELAKQKIFIRNPESKASFSAPKKLKLQFMNKIALPVFTGMPLLGENQTPIEIALVDAHCGEIVITGNESAAKLEILGFRVSDDENDDCSLTYEDLQEKIRSERNGRRILQGNTRLQLKQGVGSVQNISFTHNSKHTRNGLYRLVAVVVDADLMNEVKIACTETFIMKDHRCKYHEKHLCPLLSDKVCHLQQISYNGARYKRLKEAKVYTVNDLLRQLYTDPKRLEDILDLKASSKDWNDIVKNAQASNAVFLYLDPRNEQKTGVVLDVKLQLKALIAAQDLVKFASEHFDMLHPFDHETSLEEHLQSCNTLPSFRETDGPTIPSSHATIDSHGLNNLNHKLVVTTQSERGKEKIPLDNEMILSTNDYQQYVPVHLPNSKRANMLKFGAATEPGTSHQAVKSLLDTCESMDTFDINGPMLDGPQLASLLYDVCGILNENPNECRSNQAIISFYNIAQARWTKVSKLLRRNSVRISLSQGIQPTKKQRCFWFQHD
ncbi:hypothetical protein R6Q57_020936 [Mikania cordata]